MFAEMCCFGPSVALLLTVCIVLLMFMCVKLHAQFAHADIEMPTCFVIFGSCPKHLHV